VRQNSTSEVRANDDLLKSTKAVLPKNNKKPKTSSKSDHSIALDERDALTTNIIIHDSSSKSLHMSLCGGEFQYSVVGLPSGVHWVLVGRSTLVTKNGTKSQAAADGSQVPVYLCIASFFHRWCVAQDMSCLICLPCVKISNMFS